MQTSSWIHILNDEIPSLISHQFLKQKVYITGCLKEADKKDPVQLLLRPLSNTQQNLQFPIDQGVVLIFNFFLLAAVILLLGILFIATLYNVLINRTSVEAAKNGLRVSLHHRIFLLNRQASPYDMGLFANVCQVLGPRVWAWPLPLPSSYQLAGLGDGLVFMVNDQPMVDHVHPELTGENSEFSSLSSKILIAH